MRKVSKINPLPLYYQIKDIILEMIENEELKPGEMLPAEREICEIQGVSRMTVNKAILDLVNEGVVYREQGKGTFVSIPKEKQQIPKLKSFTEEMEQRGLKYATRMLSFRVKPATKQLRTILALDKKDAKVIEIIRLRISNEEPYVIETTCIPEEHFSDITEEVIEGNSLYNIFREKYEIEPTKAKQTIEPIVLNDYEADLLSQKPNSLALLFNITTFLKDGMPIEYTRAVYRSDKYKYEMVLE